MVWTGISKLCRRTRDWRDDEFGFANVEDKLPELEKVLGKENVSVRIVDGLGHGFGIGNETKVKNWLQEAVIFWEAHR